MFAVQDSAELTSYWKSYCVNKKIYFILGVIHKERTERSAK